MCAGARPSRLFPRARRDVDVWFLNGTIIAAAVLLFLFEVRHFDAIADPHIPWWGLAILFAVGERCVVHVHFRHSAHSFSFGDVPLVFGLVFSSGPELIVAGLIGCALPLVIDRQLPLVKTIFNLGQFALGAVVAELILHTLTAATDVVHPSVWTGVLAAVEASALLSVLLIGAAIALSEGRLPTGMLREMALRDLAVTITNTSIALAAAIIVGIDARALPLIIVPAATVFLAYRAYTAERARHERLEFLYEATRTLARSPEIILALEGLLTRSLEAFRAEMAEVVLVSDNEGQPPLRTTVDHTGRREAMTPIDADVADELIELVKTDGPVIAVAAPFGSPRVRDYMAEHGVTHAMIALLRDDERIVGTLMLANRPGVVRDFSDEDLKLFEALANNTSVALQFDRLEQSIWQMRELQEQLQHQAFHDPLTDLANRSLFNNQVRDALARGEGSIAVLFVDVDDFKTVNDTLGHAVGDELLTRIADRLRACILPTDVVARLGGDEFAVLVQHVEDPRDAARAVAERILSAFDLPAAAGPRQLKVRLTIGIATGQPGVDHADEIIRNADIAMYHAKRAGKNSWKIFEPSMRAAVLARHGLHSELEQAIARDEFRVDYQPICSLSDDLLYSTEALVRWTRPGQGPVLPSSFIPVAEETGLIKAVGQAVLVKSCRDAVTWLERGQVHEDFAVQVNLSAIELEDPDLVTRVDAVLKESGLPANHLVLELTESAVLRDAVQGTRALTELKELGVGLALDDFGTGYSSLSYLRTLPFDMIKIARPFVEGAARHPQEASFVKMMLELGRTLGMKVVAEGIETQGQLDFVRGLECDLGQGFLLGRPDRPGEIERLLDIDAQARSARIARVA
jgi:diguanylate cyclase (GGDEF)-like protein